jgi:hypothetical protein
MEEKNMGRSARNTVTTILIILAFLAFSGRSANADITISMSPQCGGVGDTITITADFTSGGQFYRYFVRPPGESFQMIQDWTTAKTINWTPSRSGKHIVVAQVSDVINDPSPLRQMGGTYDVGGTECPHPVQVTLIPASGAANETVTITAVAEGSNLLYRFFVRSGDFRPPNVPGSFMPMGDWTANNSFEFTPDTSVGLRLSAAEDIYTLIVQVTSDPTNPGSEMPPKPQGGLVYVVTAQPTPDGAALYAQHCAACHRPLESSDVMGKSAAQIQSAIDGNEGEMGSLSSLTTAEVQAIADALGQLVARVKSKLLNILN